MDKLINYDHLELALTKFKAYIDEMLCYLSDTESIDELTAFKESVESNIDLSDSNKVSIKKDPYEFYVSTSKISFIESGTEIANVQNSKMNITDAAVQSSLEISNFKFVPGTDGNLSIVWNQSDTSTTSSDGDDS